MFLAIIGIILAGMFGFYAGHAPQSKWPKAELLASCILAGLLVVLVLLWKQYSQGACVPPSPAMPYGSPGVCSHIFTSKNVLIGWSAFLTGLALGLLYQLATKHRGITSKSRKAEE